MVLFLKQVGILLKVIFLIMYRHKQHFNISSISCPSSVSKGILEISNDAQALSPCKGFFLIMYLHKQHFNRILSCPSSAQMLFAL